LFFCGFWLIPEIGIMRSLLFFFNQDGFAINVKDASLTHPGVH